MKRAEVLENFLAGGICLSAKSTIPAGFLKLEGSVWPRVQACLNLSPPSLRWQRRSSLSICGLPSPVRQVQVPCRALLLRHLRWFEPVKTKLSPSPFASSTNSGRLFNVLSGSTLLPSSLQALSYRRLESLCTDLQLRGKQVLAMITDGAAINRAAVRNLDPRKRLCRRWSDGQGVLCTAKKAPFLAVHNTPLLDITSAFCTRTIKEDFCADQDVCVMFKQSKKL